ncbi:MAG: ATP phosphoribosyltransferase [Candidatus Micrarchaeota archaeon]
MKIAIPNKGRLYDKTVELLELTGIKVPKNERKLIASTNIEDIKIIFARALDIPWYVESKAADVGITGEDMIMESGADVEKLLKLNFGSCRIALASQNGKKDRIATKLPNIAKKYFPNATIINMNGGCEAAPKLGISDAIVDQVSSGDTLNANNLNIDRILFESSIYLIGNSQSKDDEKVEELKLGLEGVLTAEEKRYIMYNVTSDKDLKTAVKVTPAMESPTVLKLAKEGEYSVHSVVDVKELMPAIRKIKEAGGKDILVLNMSRVVS